MADPFTLLDIDPSADVRTVKRAYAVKLKTVRPDEDPDGFQRLNEAYKRVLALVEQRTEAGGGSGSGPGPGAGAGAGAGDGDGPDRVRLRPPVRLEAVSAPGPSPSLDGSPPPGPSRPPPPPLALPPEPPMPERLALPPIPPSPSLSPSTVAPEPALAFDVHLAAMLEAMRTLPPPAFAAWLQTALGEQPLNFKSRHGQSVLTALLARPAGLTLAAFETIMEAYGLNDVLQAVRTVEVAALRKQLTAIAEHGARKEAREAERLARRRVEKPIQYAIVAVAITLFAMIMVIPRLMPDSPSESRRNPLEQVPIGVVIDKEDGLTEQALNEILQPGAVADRGDYAGALALYDAFIRSHALGRTLGDDRLLVYAHFRRGEMLEGMGDGAQAIGAYRHSLALFGGQRDSNIRAILAAGLVNAGLIDLEKGRLDPAVEAFGDVDRYFSGDPQNDDIDLQLAKAGYGRAIARQRAGLAADAIREADGVVTRFSASKSEDVVAMVQAARDLKRVLEQPSPAKS